MRRVRYRVNAAASEIYHCHCSLCRKLHGALFATWAVVPRGRLEVIEQYVRQHDRTIRRALKIAAQFLDGQRA